jgi:hypothetical protein
MEIHNGFIWKLITHKAIAVYNSGLFEVYRLNSDGTESLCESIFDVREALKDGVNLALEVGYIPS